MKTWIILFIFSTFLFGSLIVYKGENIVLMEIYLIKTYKIQFTDLYFGVRMIALIITHLSMLSLLFLTKSRYFRTYLMIIPLIFLVSYLLNALVIFAFMPLYFISLIPFLVLWVVCLALYRPIHINRKVSFEK